MVLTEAEKGRLGLHRKSLRVRLGLDQDALATKAGVSTRTVWSAEQGESVTESRLRAIADVLGVSLAVYVDPDIPVSASPVAPRSGSES